MRGMILPAIFAAICLLGAPRPGQAQTNPPAPASRLPQVLPAASSAPHQAVPWSDLSAEQQRMLAPLQGEWAQMNPWRQHRLAHHATRWATLPVARQQDIRNRLTHWAAMTPDQRRQLRENARAFHDLTPAQQAKVTDAFQRFQSLTPTERRALWERWRTMSREQRGQWMRHHAADPASAQSSRTH